MRTDGERAEMKRWLLQYESLEEKLDQLTKEYDNQVDINHQLEKGKRCNLPKAAHGIVVRWFVCYLRPCCSQRVLFVCL